MSGGRFVMFLTTVLSVWALIHAYVFWRLASVPWVAAQVSRRALAAVALGLWASYVAARVLGARRWDAVAVPLEWLGATWMGVVFLLFAALVVADVATLGGGLFSRHAPALRGVAVITAGVLSAIALIQGLRPPVVSRHEVRLAGLPKDWDGLILVCVSDLHLGTLIGPRWAAQLVRRVNDLQPDLIILAGDIVDGDARHVEPALAPLKDLRAPLGIWAITGNHEFYVGIERSVQLIESTGARLLRDQCVELAPGLALAGVDDLTARRQIGLDDEPVRKALAKCPPGAAILLSHTPWRPENAAAAGAGLMLSGHTHRGQIWPFSYLVRMQYPYVGGRYQVGDLTLIVGRGTGTWGPRMRLWQPSEILVVSLRS